MKMNRVKYTTEEYIKQAKKIHKDKYDWSKVVYVDAKTKVCIICPIHGEFWQRANNHLSGCGCLKCYNERRNLTTRMTTEEFIKKARKIHGDKFDYSKVEYINNRTKVCIICPEHGEFWQTPGHHLQGHGCPKCSDNMCLTNEEFIKRANKIHKDKYDYRDINYVNNHTPIQFCCKKHGMFLQLPTHHLKGHGCPKCAIDNSTLTLDDFIKKATEIHGNKYNYSKVEYKDSKTKVCIICPKHGEFLQIANSHLKGHGCPKCNQSKLETKTENFLKDKKIKYIHEKKFQWLGLQRLDFYLSEYNVAIECQGEQHFIPVDFGGRGKEKAKEEFEERIEHDNKKKKLCEEHNIKIFYINYNEDINAKLNIIYNYLKDE